MIPPALVRKFYSFTVVAIKPLALTAYIKPCQMAKTKPEKTAVLSHRNTLAKLCWNVAIRNMKDSWWRRYKEASYARRNQKEYMLTATSVLSTLPSNLLLRTEISSKLFQVYRFQTRSVHVVRTSSIAGFHHAISRLYIWYIMFFMKFSCWKHRKKTWKLHFCSYLEKVREETQSDEIKPGRHPWAPFLTWSRTSTSFKNHLTLSLLPHHLW